MNVNCIKWWRKWISHFHTYFSYPAIYSSDIRIALMADGWNQQVKTLFCRRGPLRHLHRTFRTPRILLWKSIKDVKMTLTHQTNISEVYTTYKNITKNTFQFILNWMELYHTLYTSNAEIQRVVKFKRSPKCKNDLLLNLFITNNFQHWKKRS